MTLQLEALRLARETLQSGRVWTSIALHKAHRVPEIDSALAAIDAALAQPAHLSAQPVAVVRSVSGSGPNAVAVTWRGGFPQIGDKLYTTPPPPADALGSEALREALIEVAAAHAWLAFGECRAYEEYGHKSRPLAPDEADRLARAALATSQAAPAQQGEKT